MTNKLSKEYNWEECYDLERDVQEALESVQEEHGGEFPGVLKVRIIHDETPEE